MPEDIHPLKAARLAKGLSLVKGAKAFSLGTTGSYQVQRWEKGENIPRLIFAEKIAQVLGFESAEEVQRICREWQERGNDGKSS
ncbi:MAG TPA: helix-turn-helix transcriptional regulator [Ktedonobacteraceae bacterium]|nr:helix-turn-helix transcriptional regulator [Ktedonobacteraceae bacterium]